MALFRVVWEYTALVMMIFTSPYRLGEYHHDACSIFSYNLQCHPILYKYPAYSESFNFQWNYTIMMHHYVIHLHLKIMLLINAHVKGYLEPAQLKSSPLFTFSTKLLGQDSPSVHLFFYNNWIKIHCYENKVGWRFTKLICFFLVKIHFQINKIIKQ